MKLLQNEFDYRTWMTDEFLEYDDSPSSAMSQDELEQELQRLATQLSLSGLCRLQRQS